MGRTAKAGKPLPRTLHLDDGVWTYQIRKGGLRVRSPDGTKTHLIPKDHFDLGPLLNSWGGYTNLYIGYAPALIKRYIEVVILGGGRWDLDAEQKLHADKGVPQQAQDRGVTTWHLYARLRESYPVRRMISKITKCGESFSRKQLLEAFAEERYFDGVQAVKDKLAGRIPGPDQYKAYSEHLSEPLANMVAAGWLRDANPLQHDSGMILHSRFRESETHRTLVYVGAQVIPDRPRNPWQATGFPGRILSRTGYGGWPHLTHSTYKSPLRHIGGYVLVLPRFEDESGLKELLDWCGEKKTSKTPEPRVFESVFFPSEYDEVEYGEGW